MTTNQMNELHYTPAEDQQRERQRLETLWWAIVLLWAGTVFGVDSLGYLPQVGQAEAWSWVFFGAGMFALLGDFYRAATPDLPNPTLWDYIWAGFLMLLGLSGVMTNVGILWALGLVAIGVVLLVNTLRRD